LAMLWATSVAQHDACARYKISAREIYKRNGNKLTAEWVTDVGKFVAKGLSIAKGYQKDMAEYVKAFPMVPGGRTWERQGVLGPARKSPFASARGSAKPCWPGSGSEVRGSPFASRILARLEA
jgi:hypothetical protein